MIFDGVCGFHKSSYGRSLIIFCWGRGFLRYHGMIEAG